LRLKNKTGPIFSTKRVEKINRSEKVKDMLGKLIMKKIQTGTPLSKVKKKFFGNKNSKNRKISENEKKKISHVGWLKKRINEMQDLREKDRETELERIYEEKLLARKKMKNAGYYARGINYGSFTAKRNISERNVARKAKKSMKRTVIDLCEIDIVEDKNQGFRGTQDAIGIGNEKKCDDSEIIRGEVDKRLKENFDEYERLTERLKNDRNRKNMSGCVSPFKEKTRKKPIVSKKRRNLGRNSLDRF